ncbi:hypothetical protein [Rhizorhabdus wittichii]|uniref:hypothetical protein n=1 Tax=Rhizorhabdus wittichii TaxID=160791 RepID=UPI0012FDFFEB|nr:hypothetical protein [Rhizorhabdus wittichii]
MVRKTALIALASAVSLFAKAGNAADLYPKGDFKALFGLDYDPTRACIKPSPPYRMDELHRKYYNDEVADYVVCLRNATKSDIDYAIERIGKGYAKAIEEYTSELERQR